MLDRKQTGARIKALREQNGFSQGFISEFLCVDQSLLSKIEKGERTITMEALSKIATLCGVSLSVFHDDAFDVRTMPCALRADRFDANDACALYAVRKIALNSEQLDSLLATPAVGRQHGNCGGKVKLVDSLKIAVLASGLRKQLGVDATSPVDIFSLAFSIETLTLVFYPMSSSISGMCVKGSAGDVIAINSAMSLGRQRYSLAHELYHLYFDENMDFVCQKRLDTKDRTEKQADQFASFFLVPPEELHEQIQKIRKRNGGKLTCKHVISLEQYFGISHQAMLYRLLSDKEITEYQVEEWNHDVIRMATGIGYPEDLYRPTEETEQYKAFGHYIRQTMDAYDRDLLSDGKYDELLLDGFRADLVYGTDMQGGELLD